jgi:hypothetical protein
MMICLVTRPSGPLAVLDKARLRPDGASIYGLRMTSFVTIMMSKADKATAVAVVLVKQNYQPGQSKVLAFQQQYEVISLFG